MTLLEMKEAADYLRIDYDTFRAYVKRGLIVSVRYPSLSRAGKPRRKKLFRKETLDAFIEQSEMGTNPGTQTIVPITRNYRKGWYDDMNAASLKKA